MFILLKNMITILGVKWSQTQLNSLCMLHKLILDVDRRRRLGQGHNTVEEELGVPSLQQSAEYFEGAAHCFAYVEVSSDGFVPGDLGDGSDSGIGEAAKILDGNWLEPNPIGHWLT